MGVKRKHRPATARRLRRSGDATARIALIGKSAHAVPELEPRFREIFEQAAVGLTQIDLNGVLVDFNQKFCDMLGYSRDELLGKTVKDITHPEDYEVGSQYRMQLARRTATAMSGEKRFVRKDGTIMWGRRTMSSALDDAGRPQYVISVVEDITERKQAEERQAIEFAVTQVLAQATTIEEAMPRVIESLCAGFGYAYGARWVHDAKQGVLRSTESWCVADSAVEEFRRLSTSRVETPGGEGGVNRRVWATGEPVWLPDLTCQTTLRRREPALYAGLRSAFAFPILVGGEFYGVMEFFGREVKQSDERVIEIAQALGSQIGQFIARRQAEAALREAHDEVARQAQELKRSNAELEQFAYVASHDLQEPLRMISSYTQLLLRRYGDRFEADAKEFMEFIVDGATRMKQLIEDILAYSRIGTRGREFQPTECDEALGKALTNLRASIEDSGATVTHDPLPRVEADGAQLVQLFQNLIGNALKFRGADPPRIHVGAAERPDAWEIAVSDNGIGIDHKYYERIFLLFQRLHGKGEYGGTGIGLAICQKVVDRHGGRIWIESQPGTGSTFFFTLPMIGVAHGRTGSAGAAG